MAGVALGVGLAAIYIVPALTLQQAISSDYWWSDKFQASERLFLNPAAWRMPLEPFLAALSAVEAGLAAVVGWRAWRAGTSGVTIWAGLVLLIFVALCGLIPGLWSAPLMAETQFPWRAITIEEFALASLLALAPRSAASPLVWICAAALVLGDGAALARDLASAQHQRAGYGASSFPTAVDAPEYLPRGMLRMGPDGPEPAANIARLAATPGGAGETIAGRPNGEADVRLSANASRRVILPRFAFPSWQVDCDGRPITTQVIGPGRLVGFDAPPGATQCQLRLGLTAPERLGAAISLASLALLAAYVLLGLIRYFSPVARRL